MLVLVFFIIWGICQERDLERLEKVLCNKKINITFKKCIHLRQIHKSQLLTGTRYGYGHKYVNRHKIQTQDTDLSAKASEVRCGSVLGKDT